MNKTLEVALAERNEAIAKAIEKEIIDDCLYYRGDPDDEYKTCMAYCDCGVSSLNIGFKNAAEIARNFKEEE